MKQETKMGNGRLAAIAAAIAFAVSLFSCFVRAEGDRVNGDGVKPWAPLGVSLIASGLQVPDVEHSIFGAMLNIGEGEVKDAYFLNAGLFNIVDRTMAGVQVGLYNETKTGHGVQGGFMNVSDKFYGIQAGVLNVSSTVYGLQVGLVNFGYDFRGVQIGLLNVSEGDGGQSCMIGGFTILPILNVRF